VISLDNFLISERSGFSDKRWINVIVKARPCLLCLSMCVGESPTVFCTACREMMAKYENAQGQLGT
jgi:hypothetical protein